MEKLIGREEEKKLLRDALKSKAPELIAVYGRGLARQLFSWMNFPGLTLINPVFYPPSIIGGTVGEQSKIIL
jgi:hypothetical protein